MTREALKQSLIAHEGLKLKPYTCTAGALTIGVGRNLDANGISEAEAMAMLENDINSCIAELDRAKPSWIKHASHRQNVLIEMCFNLGITRLLKFVKMWEALENRDYDKAAFEMLNSMWAVQVGKRAQTLSNRMKAPQ
jgi:lysozyme